MLVRFQIFFIMALSSSLACSKLPVQKHAKHPGMQEETHIVPARQLFTFCFDLERCPDQSEQGGVERDGAVAVERHVHANQTLQAGNQETFYFNINYPSSSHRLPLTRRHSFARTLQASR